MIVESNFDIGNRVNIDGCKNLIGVIAAIMWRHPEVISYEVSWVYECDSKSPIIEGWRLSLSEDK